MTADERKFLKSLRYVVKHGAEMKLTPLTMRYLRDLRAFEVKSRRSKLIVK